MVEGLKRACRDLTREKFVDAMESIHHMDVGLGPGMDASYSPKDHLGFHKVFLGRIENGGVVAVTNWKEITAISKGLKN